MRVAMVAQSFRFAFGSAAGGGVFEEERRMAGLVD
jgi:hypothetical protein